MAALDLICILKNVRLWSVTSIPKDVLGKDDVLDKDSIKHCLAAHGGPGLIFILKNASLWSVTSIPKDILGKDDVLDKDSIKHCNDGCPRIQRSFFSFQLRPSCYYTAFRPLHWIWAIHKLCWDHQSVHIYP